MAYGPAHSGQDVTLRGGCVARVDRIGRNGARDQPQLVVFPGAGGEPAQYWHLVLAFVALGHEVVFITLPGDGEQPGYWLLADYGDAAVQTIDWSRPYYCFAWSQGALGLMEFLARDLRTKPVAAAAHNVCLPGTLDMAAFCRLARVFPMPKWVLALNRVLVGILVAVWPSPMVPRALYLPPWQTLFGPDWRHLVPKRARWISIKSLASTLFTKVGASAITTPLRVLAPLDDFCDYGQQAEILERQGLKTAQIHLLLGGHDLPFGEEGAREVASKAHLFFDLCNKFPV